MIKVLGDRVLIALRPNPNEIVSDGGIVLVKDPDAAKTPTQGIVMALGAKTGTAEIDAVLAIVADCDGTRMDCLDSIRALHPPPFDVEVGDCVIFSRGAGDQFSEDGVDYVVLFEAEILGICEPLSKNEAA